MCIVVAFALALVNFVNSQALTESLVRGMPKQVVQSGLGMDSFQAFTDNFDALNTSLWLPGKYAWGSSTDVNMGNGNAANVSIVKDAVGSYVCLTSPAANNVGVLSSAQQFGYGTYTARMKYTASNGTWPAFWALSDDAAWEIDAMESLGNNPAQYYMTLHYHTQIGSSGVYNNGSSLANEWHEYSFIWTPDSVIFYFDGVEKYSQLYSQPYAVRTTFDMGIMGNGVNWNDNIYDSTTFANGIPTLCVDYFSFTPLTVMPTLTPSAIPSFVSTVSPAPPTPTSIPFTATPIASIVLPTSTLIPNTVTPTAILPTVTSTPVLSTITASPIPIVPTITLTSQRLTLQPNGAAGVDTFINDTFNYGTSIYMGIGENNNKTNYYARSLIKFDLTSIPANATINSATLSLWTYEDLSANDRNINVYRMKKPFNEAQANWSNSATGANWQFPGASGANDRENTSIGSTFIRTNEPLNTEKQISFNPAKVQEMINGTFINNGFIIVAETELNDRFNYKTSDYSTSSQRPKLAIQYTLP
jgi:hypothetical protein